MTRDREWLKDAKETFRDHRLNRFFWDRTLNLSITSKQNPWSLLLEQAKPQFLKIGAKEDSGHFLTFPATNHKALEAFEVTMLLMMEILDETE